jgi:hypothetical protein
VEIVEQREAVGILPEIRGGIAVDVAQRHLAHLLLHERRVGGRRQPGGLADDLPLRVGGEALLVEREAVVQRDLVDEVLADQDAGMRVIHRCGVGRIERHGLAVHVLHGLRDQERADGADAAVGIDDRLDKAGRVRLGLGEQPVRAREGAEIEVERPVLLEQDEHVFHFLAQQRDLLRRGQRGLLRQIGGVALHQLAAARSDCDAARRFLGEHNRGLQQCNRHRGGAGRFAPVPERHVVSTDRIGLDRVSNRPVGLKPFDVK